MKLQILLPLQKTAWTSLTIFSAKFFVICPPPRSIQEPLMVRGKDGRPPRGLAVSVCVAGVHCWEMSYADPRNVILLSRGHTKAERGGTQFRHLPF